jgi:alkylation response protein AidB-like acyl-CoA dehydrogenase
MTTGIATRQSPLGRSALFSTQSDLLSRKSWWDFVCHLRKFATIFAATHGLSSELLEFHNLATDFAVSEFAPHAAQWDEEKIFPEDALRQAASLGFAGMFVSEESGGIGLTRHDGGVIIEALATGCASTTAYLTIHNMCAWMIDTFGSTQLKEQVLPPLLSMEHFASYCLTEPNAGSDAASLTTKAEKVGEDYILTGSKAFISGGGRSEVYVVMARTGEAGPKGISAFVVPSGSAGLSFGKNERKLGWNSQPTAMVSFDGVRVPASHMLGDGGDGFTMAMRGLDGGRLSIANCSVGAAYQCTKLARAYIKDRKQFGSPLAANQHLQFKLADMAAALQTSRLHVRSAAAQLDAKQPSARAFVAMAKHVATDACFNVCNDALQMHGGYGYLKDYPIERFLRDSRVHQILEGTNEVMRVITARELLSVDE